MWIYRRLRLFIYRWLIDSKRFSPCGSRPEVVVRSGPGWARRAKSTGQPRSVAIHRQITPATWVTALEYHFRFVVEYGRNRLSQPRTVTIRRVTPSACLTGHTLESGEIGPVVFDHLSTCLLIAEGTLSERSPMRGTLFLMNSVCSTYDSIPSVFHRAAADRRWSSEAVPDKRSGWNRLANLGQPRSLTNHAVTCFTH